MKRLPLLVALWLVAQPAMAWRLSGEPNDLHKWLPGDLPAPYVFNSVHDEPGIPGTGERDEVREAFEEWAEDDGSYLSFSDAGLTSTAGHGYDGESVITFADPYDDLAPGVLGLTYTFFSTSEHTETRGRHFYRIVESDIVFAEDHAFTSHEGAEQPGCLDAVDLRGVAAHEIGHLVGLGHSSTPDATMYFVIADCDPTKAELDADDAEGATFSYGRTFDVLRSTTATFPLDLRQLGVPLPWTDIDNDVVGDTGRPLVFYQLEPQFLSPDVPVLHAVKDGPDVTLSEPEP